FQMGKTLKKPSSESQAKPVTKIITKLQRFRKVASVSKRLKMKSDKNSTKNQTVDEQEYSNGEEFLKNEDIIEETENIQEEGNIQEPPMEAEENEDESVPKARSTNLIKVLNPILESNSIYTGGKI